QSRHWNDYRYNGDNRLRNGERQTRCDGKHFPDPDRRLGQYSGNRGYFARITELDGLRPRWNESVLGQFGWYVDLRSRHQYRDRYCERDHWNSTDCFE